jgi:SSS family solute:Na+ symporter
MLLGPAFVISPGLLQKVYGAASDRTVKVGVGAQAITQALFAFLPPLLGMAARVVQPHVSDVNQVLPMVLMTQLPASFGALTLAALYSAEVSTCDAILFMLATSLSQDLYKRFLRPDASDRRLLLVARLASVAGGIGGVVLALQLRTVVDALSIFYSLLGVSLFVPVLGGLYTRRSGTPEAIAAIVAGIGAALAAFFVPHAAVWWLDPAVAGLAAAALAFIVVFAVRRPR